jgi:diadenylate cyclase
MDNFFKEAGEIFNGFSLQDALDILLISALIYISFKFFIKNNALALVKVSVLLVAAALLINMIGLRISGEIVKYFLLTSYIGVLVLFSSDLKRNIWTSRKRLHFDKYMESNTEEELKAATEEIVKAVQNMAKRDTGALIVFVNNQPPAGIVESGVVLNSEISSQLLESIFIPKSPLHDGAVLIKGNKILAAGCFLPLSLEINLPKEFGTWHRAALGVSEAHNLTSIVVSEETGIISIAKDGQLKRYIDGEMLKTTIEGIYGLSSEKAETRWHRKK